jgi:hypothetical protein
LSYRLSTCGRNHSPLGRIMFQRVRIAGPVLPGNCGRSTPKTCSPSCMLASAAHLDLTIGCSCSSGPARPRSNLHCRAEVRILNHRHRRCLTGAPTSMKQLAPPLVQERPTPVQGRFLNFVEQRTRMDPSLQLGRVAKMYSHKRPLFYIWASFILSSTYETLLFFGFNSVWCILEYLIC